MDRGFIRAGHTIVWANDKSRDACASYERNLHIRPVLKDIRKVEHFPPAEIVVGCNPCQGFSVIGTRNPEDYRNYLYKEIVRCLVQVQPKFFVTENVKGLKSLYAGRFFQLMLKDFSECGYKISWKLLNAKDYGVPQDRERIFIIGVREDLDVEYQFPTKTHGEEGSPYVTLKETIGNLPAPKKGEYWDDDRFSFFYMSRNRRRSWDEVSFTIQASGRHAPLHPSSPPMERINIDRWIFKGGAENYRRLSVKECALIQTFEDSDHFVGSLESQHVQVGNAVPPLLAQRIAEAIDSCVPDQTTAVQCFQT
jgi:DNA (cytosine-5)-methyltransferase 1